MLTIELHENEPTEVVRQLPIGLHAELRLFYDFSAKVHRSFFGTARANGMTWRLHPIHTKLVPDGARAELWTYGQDYRDPQLREEGTCQRPAN